MFHKNALMKLSAALLLSMATIPEAHAQTPVTTASSSSTTSVVSPFKTCAAQNNITLPAQGSGEKLTSEQRATIWSCVKAAKKAAFQQCASEAGFTVGDGQKPTPDQHKAIHQCMKNLGFRHHHAFRSVRPESAPSI